MAPDKDRKREYDRARYLANRERILEQIRQYRAANPEKVKEQQRRKYARRRATGEEQEAKRRYRETNPDKVREQSRRTYEKRRASGKHQEAGRQWREAHPDWRRDQYQANRELELERSRAWAKANPEKAREIAREGARRRKRMDPAGESERFRQVHMAAMHGMRPEQWAALLDAQGGKCYLCERDLTGTRLRLIHVDHDHRCCPKEASCAYCRRGLAHQACNVLVGLAEDNPGLLRRIADNLEIALKDTDARLAEKPEQGTLLLAAAVEAIPVPARLRKMAG